MDVRRITRCLALVLACLLAALGGCSAIRTLYDQAEHIAAWRLDDYFDLTPEQRAAFHARFPSLHAWHRRQELQHYAALLSAVEQRLARGPTGEDVQWLRAEARTRASVALARAGDDIAFLLASLSDQQVEHAARRFERDNRKYRREHGAGETPQAQRQLRARRDIEQIEHWSGSLTRAQKVRIEALSSALPLDAETHLRDRIRRQKEFLALLQQRRDVDRFAPLLKQWLADWDAKRPADLAASLEAFDHARNAMLIQSHALLDAAQQRKVVERLRWYAGTMRELSAAARG